MGKVLHNNITKPVPSPKSSKQEEPSFNYLHIGGEILLELLPVLECLLECRNRAECSLHLIYHHQTVNTFP